MKRYIAEIEEYEKKTSVKAFNLAVANKQKIPTYFVTVAITQAIDPEKCSLYAVRQFKNEVTNKAALMEYTTFQKEVGCSSVMLTIAFSPDVRHDVLEVFTETFLTAHNITSQIQQTAEVQKEEQSKGESDVTRVRTSHFLMDVDPLQAYPELSKYLQHNVRLTGIRIGAGAFATVEEVAIPGAICAAKRIHQFLEDPALFPVGALSKASQQFLDECRLLSSLDHPNIVKFLGIFYFPGSRLPALIMERLLLSLHELLETPNESQMSLFLSAKCSILCDVANGLAYLHQRSPPVIHRDLSARNVVLNSEMRAKIVDLGVTRINSVRRVASSMTVGPGTLIYMPPEAFAPAPNYNSSLDIFSFGVLAIFTISEIFPEDLQQHTYTDEFTNRLEARTELQRREKYMKEVNKKLNAYGLRGDHPLIQLIEKCLENLPSKRPDIREVLSLLEKARAEVKDKEREMEDRRRLDKAIRERARYQNLDHILQDLAIEVGKQQQSRPTVVNLDTPYGIAMNSAGEIVFSEWGSHRVTIMDTRGQNCRTFGTCGDSQEQMRYPAGVAVNEADNIYVSSQHKLQKFNSHGKLMECIGERGVGERQFDDPRGLAIYGNQLYVSDRKNHRIQVFNLDLKYDRSIGSRGKGNGELDEPLDVTFDTAGNMYVVEVINRRVQVFDTSGQFLIICKEEENRVGLPTGVHVVDGKVYVSDFIYDHVVVYGADGQFVKSVATRGRGVGELRCPYAITSYHDKLFVCDSSNNRVYIFDIVE